MTSKLKSNIQCRKYKRKKHNTNPSNYKVHMCNLLSVFFCLILFEILIDVKLKRKPRIYYVIQFNRNELKWVSLNECHVIYIHNECYLNSVSFTLLHQLILWFNILFTSICTRWFCCYYSMLLLPFLFLIWNWNI